MADILLDSVFEVVQMALVQTDFLKDVALVKDYANFSLILRLMNWSNLNISEETVLQYDNESLYDSYDDYNGCGFSAKPIVGTTIKAENALDESDLVYNSERIEGVELKCSVPLERVDAKMFLNNSCKIEHLELENQSEETFPTKKGKNKSSIKRSISPKKSKNKTKSKKRDSSIGFSEKFKLTSKYLNSRKKGAQVENKYVLLNEEPKKYVPLNDKKCDICDFKTYSVDKLQKHLTKHSSEKPIACSLCEFRCKREDQLRPHMRIHTGEKPFKCPKCDLAFRTYGNRRVHFKIWHNGVKSESCKYCDYTAKLRSSIRTHEKTMHLQQTKLYKCQQCGATTLDETKHGKHMRAHELNISFDCFCGKSYTNQKDLRHHIKLAHRTDGRKKNISCPDCGKKYTTNAALKSHMFHHTGVRAFDCRLCDLSFNHMSSLQKHRNRKHSNEPMFHCELCNFFTDSLRERNRHFSTLMHLENVPNLMSAGSEIINSESLESGARNVEMTKSK